MNVRHSTSHKKICDLLILKKIFSFIKNHMTCTLYRSLKVTFMYNLNLRLGLANTIYTHFKFKIRIVCVGVIFNMKCVLIAIIIPNLNLIYEIFTLPYIVQLNKDLSWKDWNFLSDNLLSNLLSTNRTREREHFLEIILP